jgi:hypothetical protein
MTTATVDSYQPRSPPMSLASKCGISYPTPKRWTKPS